MKLDQRKLSIAFIVVYAICVIISAYSLFTLKDDLIFGRQVLNIDDWPAAQGVFIKLNFIIFITLLIGMGALVFLFNNRNEDVIYVEKKRNDKYISENESEEKDQEEGEMDLSSLKKILSGKTGKEEDFLKNALVEVCKILNAGLGAFYAVSDKDGKQVVEMQSSYALTLGESQMPLYELGEGLVGQVALEQKTLNIDDIPEGYVKIVSGLGNASPTNLLISPVKYNDSLFGVVEIASFTPFGAKEENMLTTAFEMITKKLVGEEKKPAKKTTKKEKE